MSIQNQNTTSALSTHIEQAVYQHLQDIPSDDKQDVYQLFLAQFELPLLQTVLTHTRGNQSKTAKILGLNRGTLRSKLKQHGLL